MNDVYKALSEAKIELLIKLPGEINRQIISVTIPDHEAESLSPLPRDREVPFMPESARRAQAMARERHLLIGQVAENLAALLIKYIESKDTQHGYSPDECRQKH